VGLDSLVAPDLIFPELAGPDPPAVLRDLAERLAARGLVRDADLLYQKLWEREQLGSTGIGSGVAIPHCKMKGLERAILAVGMVPDGIDFGAVDGEPVRLLFLLVSPNEAPAEHLQALAAISRWVKADRHVEKILAAADRQAIYELLHREGG
jgi:mannitol/fructose-specific phosphotransferase system IIA component (Ntr-type)